MLVLLADSLPLNKNLALVTLGEPVLSEKYILRKVYCPTCSLVKSVIRFYMLLQCMTLHQCLKKSKINFETKNYVQEIFF